ncbi:hypothetical protein FQA39_LY10693 [Lamprigera yunnana]|nr:hypothetical protein FQA39_LY10693 [Lamprigera yunnana]
MKMSKKGNVCVVKKYKSTIENKTSNGKMLAIKVSLTKSDERMDSHLKDNDNVEDIMRTCVFEDISDNEFNEEQQKEQPNPEFVFVDNENKLQSCDMMWKLRQIGSKTLTFEMIEEKKILRIEDVCGNEVYLGWESVSEMWMLYAEQHWTKAINLKSAVERLYENLGALEFDADNEALYGMEKYYTVEQCEKLRDNTKSLVKRISDIGLQHILATINKYIKDCSDSDTSSYLSDEEECKTVEQNGEGSKTAEEESKKSEGELNQFHSLKKDSEIVSTKF